MKNIITIIFSLTFLTVFSQEQKIEGIGQFKISKTTINIINELANQMNVKIIEISNDVPLDNAKKNRERYIFQLIKDSSWSEFMQIPYSTNCPGFSVYTVSEIAISSFFFDNVYLTFYQDTLISFKSDHVENLDQALAVKFGKPELFDDEKDINCVYTYTGATIKKKEMNLKQTWENHPIEAIISDWQFYTSDCEIHIISGFSVENTDLMSLLYQCERDQEGAIKQKENDELKKRSDGL